MASQRPSGNPNAPRRQLLELDDSQPIYSSGARPPANDDQLLQRFNIDDSEDYQARTSVSYDQFVGSGPASLSRAPAPTSSSTAPTAPYLSTNVNRTYSQTSELQNYQRYHDEDIDDERSVGGYYAAGGIDDSTMGEGRIMQSRGGIMSRAKNMLGMHSK